MSVLAPFLRLPAVLRRATASSPSFLRRFASALPAPSASAIAPGRKNIFLAAAAATTLGAGLLWSHDHSILSAGERSSSALVLQTQLHPSVRAQLEKAVDEAMRSVNFDRKYSVAIEVLRDAANHGLASAQFNLGVMYATGRGVDVDEKEAVRLYKLASSQGDADAQCILALMYASGRGVEQSDAAAAQHFALAAARGDSFAQVNLANMYETGKGVPQDSEKAITLYRQAAEQGCLTSARALKRLGH